MKDIDNNLTTMPMTGSILKWAVPILKDYTPLNAYDLVSVQPMTMETSIEFITKMAGEYYKIHDWDDYFIEIYKNCLEGFDGYKMYKTSFDLIEKKYKDDIKEKVGKKYFLIKSNNIKEEHFYEEKDCSNIVNYNRYKQFKEKYKEGDCVVYYKSPPYSWGSLCGREGFFLIRDEKIIDDYIMIMS